MFPIHGATVPLYDLTNVFVWVYIGREVVYSRLYELESLWRNRWFARISHRHKKSCLSCSRPCFRIFSRCLDGRLSVVRALNNEYLRIRLLHFTISINLFEYELVLVIVMWDGCIFDHFWYTGLKMSNLGSALKIDLKTIFQFYFNTVF